VRELANESVGDELRFTFCFDRESTDNVDAVNLVTDLGVSNGLELNSHCVTVKPLDRGVLLPPKDEPALMLLLIFSISMIMLSSNG
jgi:hypothetical protein